MIPGIIASAILAPPTDPYWSYVVAGLHFEGANGSTVFTDITGRTWTANGNAALSTASKPFGASSLALDGTGDWAQTADDALLSVVVGDCCIEAMICITATGKTHTISNKRDSSGAEEHSFQVTTTQTVTFSVFNGSAVATVTSTTVLSTGVFYHVAASKQGDTWRLFINGTLEATATQSGAPATNVEPLKIGRDGFNTSRDFQGFIKDYRFTKGVARYTANFSAPVRMFPDTGLWTPAKLTAPPKAWLDDESDVTNVSGAASVWFDRYGATRFSQATAANRPAIVAGALNSRRVIRFDGSNDHLDTTVALNTFQNVATAWKFVVMKKTTNDGAPTSRRLWFASCSTDIARVAIYSDDATSGNANKAVGSGRNIDGGTYSFAASAASVSNVWAMVLSLMSYSGRTINLWRDGVLDATTSTAFNSSANTSNTASSNWNIGASPAGGVAWGGDLALAMAGVGLPSAGEIDKIFGFAAWRYGLQSLLPIGHPYKNAAP